MVISTTVTPPSASAPHASTSCSLSGERTTATMPQSRTRRRGSALLMGWLYRFAPPPARATKIALPSVYFGANGFYNCGQPRDSRTQFSWRHAPRSGYPTPDWATSEAPVMVALIVPGVVVVFGLIFGGALAFFAIKAHKRLKLIE